MAEVSDLRGHITLVKQEYRHRTARLPNLAHESWSYLMAEARIDADTLGIDWRKGHLTPVMEILELWLDTTPSVSGWGQMRLVDAMTGEKEAKNPPAGAFLTTLPPREADKNGHEDKKKGGIIGRFSR